jgi:hypothetical protein
MDYEILNGLRRVRLYRLGDAVSSIINFHGDLGIKYCFRPNLNLRVQTKTKYRITRGQGIKYVTLL